MKTILLIIVCATAAGLMLAAAGCGHSSNKTIQDQQSAQGHWNGYNANHPGDKCTVNITGNKFEYHGADPKNWSRGTFVFRGDLKPKEMDLTILEPANQSNQVLLAIYELEGDKMTVAMSSVQRPADFIPNPQIEVFYCTRD